MNSYTKPASMRPVVAEAHWPSRTSGDALLARFCGVGRGDPADATPASPVAAFVLAHPDDEVVGAGARLTRLRDAIVVHVTDGAPRDMRDARDAGFASREAYAAARRRERAAALAVAGIAPERTRDLGVVDQEASLALAALARRVAALLDALRPDVVVTHPYEGGHPDHDATAFAVHTACALLRRDGAPAPVVLEQTSYHNRGGTMATGEFLTDRARPVLTTALSDAECRTKRRMVACYETQARVLGQFPIGAERFRVAPRYDFARAPHDGVLWYECFDWGMTGARWRALAGHALSDCRLTAAGWRAAP